MGYDSGTEDKVMWATVGLIFSIMIVNYIDMGVCMYLGFKSLYQKWKNRKERQVTSVGSDSPASKNELDKKTDKHDLDRTNL